MQKYPRTRHLPNSRDIGGDDKVWPSWPPWEGKGIVVSAKMDGENSTFMRDSIFARSPNGGSHPSRSWVRGLHASIAPDIPEGWRICGENLFARHSIAYSELPSYFMVFAIILPGGTFLPWDDVEESCEILGLETVPVLYRGPYSREALEQFEQFACPYCAEPEGFVVRLSGAFCDFGNSVAKFVARAPACGQHWMFQPVVPNSLAVCQGKSE